MIIFFKLVLIHLSIYIVNALELAEEFKQSEESLSNSFDRPEFSLHDLTQEDMEHYADLFTQYVKDPKSIDISKYPLVQTTLEHYQPIFVREQLIPADFQFQPQASDFSVPGREAPPVDEVKSFRAKITEIFTTKSNEGNINNWVTDALAKLSQFTGKDYSANINFPKFSTVKIQQFFSKIKAKFNKGPLNPEQQQQHEVIQNIENGIDLTQPVPDKPNNLISGMFKSWNAGKYSLNLNMYPKLKEMFKLHWNKLAKETAPSQEIINKVFDLNKKEEESPEWTDLSNIHRSQIQKWLDDVADALKAGPEENVVPPRAPENKPLPPPPYDGSISALPDVSYKIATDPLTANFRAMVEHGGGDSLETHMQTFTDTIRTFFYKDLRSGAVLTDKITLKVGQTAERALAHCAVVRDGTNAREIVFNIQKTKTTEFTALDQQKSLGILLHEMVHAYQNLGQTREVLGDPILNKKAIGTFEGIAEYIRVANGFDDFSDVPPPNRQTSKWYDGYMPTAKFLDHVAKNYKQSNGLDIVANINHEMRNGYSDGIFLDLTGKSVDTLWEEYLKSFGL